MIRKFVKKHKKAVFITTLILIVLFGGYFYLVQNKAASTAKKFAEFKVMKRTISNTISGSGTVASAYRQEISSKVDGTITKVHFKEGDKVKKGDLMIEIDDQDIVKNIERTKLSIKQAQSSLQEAEKDIAGLSVTAPINGQVINFSIKEGDEINRGAEICTINDNSKLVLTVSFNYNQIKKIYVGQKAEVYLQDYMQIVSGKVTYVDKTGRPVDGGGKVYDVELMVSNPGTISAGIKASAKISGEMCMDSTALEYKSLRKVKAEVGGTVKSVAIKNNQQVKAGQVMFKMEDSSLYNQLLAAQIKLDDLKVQLNSQLEQQENYKVYAPVTGTIVSQDLKVGDNVETKNDVLSVVADYDQMEFQIDVDELDIDKISVGMEVNVTLDALENQRFKGEVTKVANEGTSSNGVATYPIIVKIENPKNIKGGMNANAEIVIQKEENVLALPTNAIQNMGMRSYVYTKKKAGDSDEVAVFLQKMGERQNSKTDSSSTKSSDSSSKNASSASRGSSETVKLQSNMTRKFVETGLSDDDYIEITSGLSEGDTVYIPVTTSSSNSRRGVMMGGPMNGGGPPSGGFNRNSSSGSSSRNNRSNSSR